MEVGHRWDRGIRVVGETWARISTRYMWGLVLDGASFYIFYQLYSFKIKKINKCPSMKIFGLFPSNLMNCP